jgi:hypothetical protein
MPLPNSLLKSAALIFSISLAGCFLYYRGTANNAPNQRPILPGSKSYTGQTALNPGTLNGTAIHGSKWGTVARPSDLLPAQQAPIPTPSTGTLPLPNEIVLPPRTVIMPSSKGGILINQNSQPLELSIDPQPTSTPRTIIMTGSKSAAIFTPSPATPNAPASQPTTQKSPAKQRATPKQQAAQKQEANP